MFRLAFLLFITLPSSYISENGTVPNNEITISKIECGSCQVAKENKTLGYVVYPFDVIKDDPEKLIKNYVSAFEDTIQINYANHYKDDCRVYRFTTNRNKEIILITIMLTKKQASLISNWKCEEMDVDTYKAENGNSFSKIFPQIFIFNCYKKRFKNTNDPE